MRTTVNISARQDCIVVKACLKFVWPVVNGLWLLLLLRDWPATRLLLHIVLIAPALICRCSDLPPLPCPEKGAVALIMWCPALPWQEVGWYLTMANLITELIHSLLNQVADPVQKAFSRLGRKPILILLQSPFYIVDVRPNNLFDLIGQDPTRVR